MHRSGGWVGKTYQDDVDIEATCDEPGGLEEGLIVVLKHFLLGVSSVTLLLAESATFIDLSKVLDKIIVPAIEHDQERANSRRES